MELLILITCGILLVLNIIIFGLYIRSRNTNPTRDIARDITELEKVIRDESRYNRENDENRSRKDREELASSLNNFRTENHHATTPYRHTSLPEKFCRKHGTIQPPATGKIG